MSHIDYYFQEKIICVDTPQIRSLAEVLCENKTYLFNDLIVKY